MNKGISSEIREILSDGWCTISDVMDKFQDGAREDSVMQMISRMKKNGVLESREICLLGRTVKSYRVATEAKITTR
jgi:hypothetical protein